MRILRFVGAAIMILTSGLAIFVDNGVRPTVQNGSIGRGIYPSPSHSEMYLVVYLVIGLTFPLISAWLIAPPGETDRRRPENLTSALWGAFYFRLCFSVACSILVALLLVFLAPALIHHGL